MSAALNFAERIAELNDRFRRALASPLGQVVMTSGIASLEPELVTEIWSRVQVFEDFTLDDIYGEHDFGSFRVEGVGKIFWKIDYYADASCGCGSDDPADPARSYRVLTIMLAEEY